MENCLKTQLRSSVQNDNLMKLGVIELEVTYNESYGENVNKIQFAGNGTKIKIVGEGVLATTYANVESSTLKEYTIASDNALNLFFSNGNYTIEVSKYDVTRIAIDPNSTNVSTIIFKIQEELRNASSLSYIVYNNSQEADLDYLSRDKIYNYLYATSAHGDVTGLKTQYFNVPRQPIYGDFTDIVKYAGSTTARGGRMLLTPVGTDKVCSCDLSESSEYIYFIIGVQKQQKINCIWTKTRDSSYPIISFNGDDKLDFGGYLDAMLINQASCTATQHGELKTISVSGIRTSASDLAVETLKGNGYTVIVNGKTL